MDILWALVVLLSISLFVFLMKRQRMKRMLDKIPGPKCHPIIGFAYEMIGVPREELTSMLASKLHGYAKLGIFLIWVGPFPVVFLAKPSYIEKLLSSQVHLDKSFLPYSFTHSWLGQGLLTSSGAKWHSRRKLLTPAFHFRILEEFLPVFNEQSQILVNKIDSTQDYDLFNLITLCTLDIICEENFIFGIEHFNFIHVTYVNSMYKFLYCYNLTNSATKAIFHRAKWPFYYPNFIYKLSTSGRKYNRNVNILKNFTAQIIKTKREEYRQGIANGSKHSYLVLSNGSKRKLAFLDLLLEYSGDGNILNDRDIQEEVDTFMFEGHDTTTAGIFWTLYCLGLEPEVQKKVHKELDSVFENSDRHVCMDDFSKLKYLEMVCKEALRMIPPVPIIARHLKEDLNVGDYVIPAGVQCCISSMMIHHFEEYFENPKVFDPDRFLPENCKGRHPYAYIPFSAGARNCIGQKFAMIEEKVVLSNLLRKFEVKTERLPEGVIPVISEIINRPISKIKISLERRKNVSIS